MDVASSMCRQTHLLIAIVQALLCLHIISCQDEGVGLCVGGGQGEIGLSTQAINNWQAVEQEVRRRIHTRDWKPGELIPKEADLALEFGCARTTVNRALRGLADAGLLDRRRKAGTRVALHPVGKAVLDIPVIRQEIERRGSRYGYTLIHCDTEDAPKAVETRIGTSRLKPLLHVVALHTASDAPFVVEDRWIDLDVVPAAETAPFKSLSANEWLLMNAPYTRSEIVFTAIGVQGAVARMLGVKPTTAAFLIERTTWDAERPVTAVDLTYAPGYRMQTTL